MVTDLYVNNNNYENIYDSYNVVVALLYSTGTHLTFYSSNCTSKGKTVASLRRS